MKVSDTKQKQTQTLALPAEQPVFVISDLHLGDGRTQFARTGKEADLLRFLDHIATQEGTLVVLGDLLELWRYTCEAVLDRWHGLLDRLDQLQVVYVPGNHDAQVADPVMAALHPLFQRIYQPFIMDRAGQQLRFMHGHEIDPFIEGGIHECPLYRRCFQVLFDVRERAEWLRNELLADVGLGMTESLLRCWHWLSQMSHHVLHPELQGVEIEPVRLRLRDIRTQKMLSRYCYHRDAVFCDKTIVGHTHRVGRFSRWYYNSGCWVKPNNSFLKIHPDAHVEVFDWMGSRAYSNPTVVLGN